MKKLAIIALLPCAMLISACSSMPNSNDYSGWNDYNFNNATVDSILIPGQGYQQPSANYQRPRQYYVTQQDQQEYSAINNRVQQRQQQLQQTSISATSASTTGSDYNQMTQTPTQQNMHY